MYKRSRTAFFALIPVVCVSVCVAMLALSRYLNLSNAQTDLLFILGLVIVLPLLIIYILFLKNYLAAADHASQFERQAYTDAMTQVRNRAAFNLKLERLDALSYPNLTLFMLDLNNLKQVNDTLGHPAGDKLICALVNCLEKAFGKIGQIYRYGGDEFVVIIEDAEISEVHAARNLFDKLILDHSQHGNCEISVAIGMSTRQEPQNATLHVAELMRLADVAMYQFKRSQKASLSYIDSAHHRWIEQIDAVTGILTYSAFKSRVYDAIASGLSGFPCIVNFDLNFFDGYNNLFGWDAGNQLLQKLTALALNLCGDKGFCAHGEADSFWVFTDFANLETLIAHIQKETAHLHEQLGELSLFPSFGIYCVSDQKLPVSDMCSRAASTKRAIKGRLDVLYNVYDAEVHHQRIDNMRLMSYMQKGLSSNEIIPYYQPRFSADGQRILGAEALVRWLDNSIPANSPADFTDLFEKSGLILLLDWHMLEKVCDFLKRQQDTGQPCVPVSVNFSRLHMYESDCVERICRIVEKYQIPRNMLEIELTETALIQDLSRLLELISTLCANGFSVAIDNFGNGLSSLSILKDAKVDTVKLTPSLFQSGTAGDPANLLLGSIISMCKQLKINTIAESVETPQQMDILVQSGCDMLQGRLFAPVMSETDLVQLLSSRSPYPQQRVISKK